MSFVNECLANKWHNGPMIHLITQFYLLGESSDQSHGLKWGLDANGKHWLKHTISLMTSR